MSRELRSRRKGPRLIGGDDLALAVVEDGAAFAAQMVRDLYHHAVERCESPIERIFCAQMLHPQWTYDYSVGEHPIPISVLLPNYAGLAEKGWTAEPPPAPGIYVFPQFPVANYRVDFLIWGHRLLHYEDLGDRRLIIECDGHDFHEKTKEQVRRDKAREREIVASGIPVMRFAGSEIYADSAACVQQALDFLMELK